MPMRRLPNSGSERSWVNSDRSIPERRKCIIQTPEKLTPAISQTSTSCAEDSPARHFLRLAGDEASKMPEALSSLRLPGWLKQSGLRICSLRTFPDCFRMTRDGRFLSSLPHFCSWGTASNGWCLTAPISESPRQDAGCSLSDILIPDAPEKYFLSSAQVAKLLYKCSRGRKAPESTTAPVSHAHRQQVPEEKEEKPDSTSST